MEVQKYMRTANQVVKSLPENRVGPKFQKMVERFREVVPVMVDLCNPDLRAKASHMAEVNIVLGVDVLSEELTVGALIDTDLVASMFPFLEEWLFHVHSCLALRVSDPTHPCPLLDLWFPLFFFRRRERRYCAFGAASITTGGFGRAPSKSGGGMGEYRVSFGASWFATHSWRSG